MREAARRVRLDRQAVKFPLRAEALYRTRGIEAIVQIDTAQTIFTGERMFDARQAATRHQCGGDRVRCGEAGLHVLGLRAFTRRLVVAAREAIHDAQRVAQRLGTRIDQARGGERCAEVSE